MTGDPTATFERLAEIDAEEPTLIEGLPGHGMVASIAVDQITDQLGLDHYGTIRSGAFPSVLSFEDGRSRDAVRVYGGEDPDVLTLQSDVPVPESAHRALSDCVLEELADEFGRAIFLVGAPAQNEGQIGSVSGVATDDDLRADLERVDISLAEGPGLVGGVTGALANACHEADVPAAVLVVRANPRLPDPGAARAAIETALEPLVEFDIDTTDLQQQAENIQQRKQQIAEQVQQYQEGESKTESGLRMYR